MKNKTTENVQASASLPATEGPLPLNYEQILVALAYAEEILRAAARRDEGLQMIRKAIDAVMAAAARPSHPPAEPQEPKA